MKMLQITRGTIDDNFLVTSKDIADTLGLKYDEETNVMYFGENKEYGIRIELIAAPSSNYDDIIIHSNLPKESFYKYFSIYHDAPAFLVYEKNENGAVFGIKCKDYFLITTFISNAIDNITGEEKVMYVLGDNNGTVCYAYVEGMPKIIDKFITNQPQNSVYMTLSPFCLPNTGVVAKAIYISNFSDGLSALNYPINVNLGGKEYIGQSLINNNCNRLFFETEIEQ